MAIKIVDKKKKSAETKVFISEKEIQKKVMQLAKNISRDYADKNPVLVCVLKGAVIFLSDLLRHINIFTSIDFMAISSYGKDTETSGVVRILKDLDTSIESKHILVVEDIIDSGLTLHYLLNNLRSRNPASLKVCTLLSKTENRKVEVKVDYNGFEIPNKFVVGYGLDFNETYRNLPYIALLNEEVVL